MNVVKLWWKHIFDSSYEGLFWFFVSQINSPATTPWNSFLQNRRLFGESYTVGDYLAFKNYLESSNEGN